MRRIFTFALVLVLTHCGLAAQSMYVHYIQDWLNEPEELSIRRRIEKPGVTAHEIFRAFLFPKHNTGQEIRINGGDYTDNYVSSYRQCLDALGAHINYYYYVYAFDDYYIVSLEHIFVMKGGHHFVVYGMNGVPFKREHTRQDYKLALKIVDFLQPKFEELCNMLEEYAFPALTPTN